MATKEKDKIDWRYMPRVDKTPEEVLKEVSDIQLGDPVSINEDVMKAKKKQLLLSIEKNNPDIYEFMKEHKGQMTKEMQEEWLRSLSIDELQGLRMFETMQSPKKDLGFDYYTGVPSTEAHDGAKLYRYSLASLDTNTEKEDYLNENVGYDGWNTDAHGNYALTQKGLDVLGLPPLQEGQKGRIIDEFQGGTKYDWIEAGSYWPQITGAIVAGTLTSGYGLPIGLVASGTGASMGYLGDEYVEYLKGWSNQSAESIAWHTGEEFIYGAVGEGFARFLRPFGRVISDPHGGFFQWRPTPYTKEGVLKAYPDLVKDIRTIYGDTLNEKQIQGLIDKAVKKLKYKTVIPGEEIIPDVPGTIDPFNPATRVKSIIPNERRALVDKVLKGEDGYYGIPSIDAATAGLKPLWGRIQGMLDTVFKAPVRHQQNVKYLNYVMTVMRARAAGIPEKEIANFAAKMNTKGELQAIEDIQKQILQRATDKSMSYTDAINLVEKQIEQETGNAIRVIQNNVGFLSDDLARSIEESVLLSKSKYNTTIATTNNALDDALNGTNILETGALKQIAERIYNNLPKVTQKQQQSIGPGLGNREVNVEVIDNKLVPSQVSDLLEGIIRMQDRIPAGVMDNIEATLRTYIGNSGAFVNIIKHNDFKSMLKAIDQSYKSADGVLNTATTKLKPADKAQLKPAYTILKELNELRAKSEIFDDVAIAKIIKDAERGGSNLSPRAILNQIINTGRVKDFNRLMHAIPESEKEIMRAQIARHSFEDLLSRSHNKITNTYEGSNFLKYWDELDPQLKQILFKEQAKEIDTLTKEIAAKNIKFSDKEVKNLLNAEDSNITKLLREKLNLQAEQDELMSKSWMKKLTGDEAEWEQAIDYIWKPKSSNRISDAQKMIESTDPKLWPKVREASMLKILTEVADDTTVPGVTIFNGPAFKQTLKRYGDPTLEAMFGKDLTKRLHDFADAVELLTSKTQSGGLVAANLALKPLREGPTALPHIALLRIISKLMNRPGFVEYLTFGMKNSKTRKGMEALARVKSDFTALGGFEKTGGMEKRQDERSDADKKTTYEKIKEKLPQIEFEMHIPGVKNPRINTEEDFNWGPVKEKEITPDIQYGSGVDVSRLGSSDVFSPVGGMNPQTMARGQQLFNKPGEITFANQGGIMSTNKAFQRVA